MIVRRRQLRWRNVADRLEQSTLIKPVHLFQRGVSAASQYGSAADERAYDDPGAHRE